MALALLLQSATVATPCASSCSAGWDFAGPATYVDRGDDLKISNAGAINNVVNSHWDVKNWFGKLKTRPPRTHGCADGSYAGCLPATSAARGLVTGMVAVVSQNRISHTIFPFPSFLLVRSSEFGSAMLTCARCTNDCVFPLRYPVGSVNGGVWRSTSLSDKVPHWENVLDGQPVTCSSISALYVSNFDASTVYAGCGGSTSSEQGASTPIEPRSIFFHFLNPSLSITHHFYANNNPPPSFLCTEAQEDST